MRYKALVSDYDLTLVSRDHLDAATIIALRRLKASGRRLVLDTGRTLPWAYGDHGITRREVALLFDRVVGENGAVMWDPRTDKVTMLGNPPSPEFIKRLSDAGCNDVTIGWASVHVPVAHRATAARIVRELGLSLHAIAGTDHDVYVDAGVDKASGMRIALAELGLQPSDAVTIGDGDNDVAMLDRRHSGAGLGIAMDNGTPRAKAAADLVTSGGPGEGVRRVIDAMIGHDLQRGLDGVSAPAFSGLDAA
jgi:hydroxymethylpyrimidine pyrophosphatase-like HAD family hydrolase